VISFKLFCEEYVYMYDSEKLLNQIRADFRIIRQIITTDQDRFTNKIYRFKSNNWEETAAANNAIEHQKMQVMHEKLIKWLKFFHEVEYKRSKLITNNIETKECDNIIRVIFEEYVQYYADVIKLYFQLHDLDHIMHTDEMIALETYMRLDGELQKMYRAKTIKDMIIGLTMSLNTMHHSGSFLEDYSYLSVEDLDELSNLDSKKWNYELHKEFRI